MDTGLTSAVETFDIVDINRLQQLEDFFVNAPVGLQLTDPAGVVTSANSGVAQLLGIDREQARGRGFEVYFADAGEFESIVAKVASGEVVNNAAVRLKRADGTTVAALLDASGRFEGETLRTIRWFVRGDFQSQVPGPAQGVEVTGEAGANEDAAIWGATLRSVDTETAIEALGPEQRRERLAELDDFFDNAPAGVHFVGFNGLILRANHAELALLGYDQEPDRYVGRHVRDIHANKPTVEDLLRRLVEGEPVINFRAKLVRRDGEIEPVVIYSGLRLRDGRFENTRCFLFADQNNDVLTTDASVPFSWPRND
jgi:PAS domain S-box-containing protein